MRHEQVKPRRQFKNYNNFNTKLKKKEFKKYPKDTGLMVTVRGDTEQDMTKAMKRFKRIAIPKPDKSHYDTVLMKLSSSDNVRKYFALHPFIVLNNEN